MLRTFDRLSAFLPGLLAVVLVCLFPSAVRADTVTFRNETRVSLVVQTATVVRGNVVRDQPCLIRPGDYTPKIILRNDKIVTVYDARTNRVLFRDVLKCSPRTDLGFSIQADPRVPNHVQLHPRKLLTEK